MIGETSSSKKSGLGTSMFSRMGKETITMNKVFKSQIQDLDELKESYAKGAGGLFRPYRPIDDEEEMVKGQPVFTRMDGQKTMEVPGLNKELARLEGLYPKLLVE